jgi:hypothetical protein
MFILKHEIITIKKGFKVRFKEVTFSYVRSKIWWIFLLLFLIESSALIESEKVTNHDVIKIEEIIFF